MKLIPKNKDAEIKTYDFAFDHQLFLARTDEAVPDKLIPRRLTWDSLDRKNFLHYVDDKVVHIPYVIIQGPEAEGLIEKFKKSLPVYSEEEILEQAGLALKEDSPFSIEEKIKALARLGIAAPEKWSDLYFQIFLKAFEHPMPDVRRIAILMTGYTGWKEFYPLLNKIMNMDKDQMVVSMAKLLIEGFDQTLK